MFTKFFLPILLFIFFPACKSRSAFDYSQNFVMKERSLVPAIEQGEERVKNFYARQRFDSIGIVGAGLEKLVDSKLIEIEEGPTPDAKGINNFKSAAIHYFEFMKSIYTQYKKLGQAATPAEREMILSKLKEIVKEKPTVIADIKAAQQKYADENNFKIEK